MFNDPDTRMLTARAAAAGAGYAVGHENGEQESLQAERGIEED